MNSTDIRTSITVTSTTKTLALVIQLLENIWSRDAAKRIVKSVATYYGMTATDN